MGGVATEILIVLLLLVLNGVFAMSELAIVTARKVRLEQRAADGDAGARAALALAHDPTQFLSTVQVGITLIGVLAGAFGGATIAEKLALGLARIPAIAPYADAIALGIVVTALTYLSLLIGELVPKRVALSQPERVASLVARPMRLLSRVAAPLVALLTGPTNLLLRLFGIRVSTEPSITVQEIRALIEQGAEIGAVEGSEHEMVEGVFRLGDRYVADVMTPRTRLKWIDVSEPPDAIRAQIIEQGTARYLMCDGEVDNVVGVAHAEDLLVRCLEGAPFDVRAVLWQPLYVPAAMTALDLLEQFRKSRQYVAIALDEFGGLQGVVMLDDLVEAVIGELAAARRVGGCADRAEGRSDVGHPGLRVARRRRDDARPVGDPSRHATRRANTGRVRHDHAAPGPGGRRRSRVGRAPRARRRNGRSPDRSSDRGEAGARHWLRRARGRGRRQEVHRLISYAKSV